MRHRVFIAINLPEDIKKELSSFREKWPELPCRWTKKENIHITLVFLGYVKDEELPEILEIVKETAARNNPFLINLKRVCYGPPYQGPEREQAPYGAGKHGTGQATDKKPYSETKSLTGRPAFSGNRPPRMVWAEGEKSKELAKLQTDLESSLQGEVSNFEKENRAFTSHITLGRLKQWEFRQMEIEERPEIEEEISLSFEVSSIEIMESKLKPQGPDYFVLESLVLGSSR